MPPKVTKSGIVPLIPIFNAETAQHLVLLPKSRYFFFSPFFPSSVAAQTKDLYQYQKCTSITDRVCVALSEVPPFCGVGCGPGTCIGWRKCSCPLADGFFGSNCQYNCNDHCAQFGATCTKSLSTGTYVLKTPKYFKLIVLGGRAIVQMDIFQALMDRNASVSIIVLSCYLSLWIPLSECCLQCTHTMC